MMEHGLFEFGEGADFGCHGQAHIISDVFFVALAQRVLKAVECNDVSPDVVSVYGFPACFIESRVNQINPCLGIASA